MIMLLLLREKIVSWMREFHFTTFWEDVVGKESVALTSLSIAFVLYKKYEDVSEFKPGILLDLTGNI